MEIQKEQSTPSNLFDQLVDQYKLEAHINQTAITDLYRAFDVDENRPVAVEILLPTYNNKKQFVEQFIDKMHKVAIPILFKFTKLGAPQMIALTLPAI